MPKFSNDSIHGHDYYDEQIGAFKVPLYLSAIFEHPDRRTPRPRLRCLNRLPNTHHAHESQRARQRRVWPLSRGRRYDGGRGCPTRDCRLAADVCRPLLQLRCLNRLLDHYAHESQRANRRRVWLLGRGERRRPDCGRGCPRREWGWVPSWGPRLRLLLLNSRSLFPESRRTSDSSLLTMSSLPRSAPAFLTVYRIPFR